MSKKEENEENIKWLKERKELSYSLSVHKAATHVALITIGPF